MYRQRQLLAGNVANFVNSTAGNLRDHMQKAQPREPARLQFNAKPHPPSSTRALSTAITTTCSDIYLYSIEL